MATEDELLECEQMLLYLTSATWTSGHSDALAKEVTSAMTAGVRILLVHEAPSWCAATPEPTPLQAEARLHSLSVLLIAPSLSQVPVAARRLPV